MYGLIPNFFPANAIANYKVETGSYNSNITTGAWRAPYTNFLASAEQSFFDELAEALVAMRNAVVSACWLVVALHNVLITRSS